MAIVFDCETYRIDDASAYLEPIVLEPVKADGRLTDPAKIAADLAKKEREQADTLARKTQEQLADCALYPYTSRIVALGWAWEGDEVASVRIVPTEATETRVLREFWAMVVDAGTQWVQPLVGFNSRGFDLPLLMVRSMLLGVPYPALNIDRYRSPHPDVMLALTFTGAIKARSLRWYAKRFGLPLDDAFSGAEIGQLVESDNWDAIEAHCRWDVLTCKAIAERIGMLKARKGVAA